MIVSAEQLHDMIPGASDRLIRDYLTPINETLFQFKIDTRLRIAAFIAQISHESGSLHFVDEIWGPTEQQLRYDLPHKKAHELGNDRPEAIAIANAHDMTPGRFYAGHGLIQITGYDNHVKCSNALWTDFKNNPRLLCEPKYAALSAGWYWVAHGRDVDGKFCNCNQLADFDLFSVITKTINGGLSGNTQRLKFYRRNLQVLK